MTFYCERWGKRVFYRCDECRTHLEDCGQVWRCYDDPDQPDREGYRSLLEKELDALEPWDAEEVKKVEEVEKSKEETELSRLREAIARKDAEIVQLKEDLDDQYGCNQTLRGAIAHQEAKLKAEIQRLGNWVEQLRSAPKLPPVLDLSLLPRAVERWSVWSRDPRGKYTFLDIAHSQAEAEAKKCERERKLHDSNSMVDYGLLNLDFEIRHEVVLPYDTWLELSKRS